MPRLNTTLLSLRAPRRAARVRLLAFAAVAALPFVPGTSALADDVITEAAFEDSFTPYEVLPPAPVAEGEEVDISALEPAPDTDTDDAEGRPLGSGVASYYAAKFHGRRTASGETFSNNAMTAAHRSLPFGSKVRVTNPRNGASVVVRINDRGPFTRGRTIDLSRAAAERVGIVRAGHGTVELHLLTS